MSKAPIIAGIAAALVIGAAIAAFAIVWRPAISPIEPPVPQAFKPELVKRGRELAAIGNCNNCHTLRGGKAFAGGLGVPTPFGSVYSSNITPDPDTGIGRWSEEAFRRAMHSGVDRAGRHLYPTFPYDHFTNVTDEDDHALYAFLMTRQPVHAPARANDLAFPLNQRFVVAGWKLLFFRRGTYQAEPAQSANWNRGAYLVEGLAHCGACHTPRNALGAEEVSASFSGGDVDNWHAYAINARSPSRVPWTGQALARYLRRGFDPDHVVAAVHRIEQEPDDHDGERHEPESMHRAPADARDRYASDERTAALRDPQWPADRGSRADEVRQKRHVGDVPPV